MEATVIINDVHIPAHDPAAVDIALSVAATLFEKGILRELILNGDIADFWNLKFHDMAPHEYGIRTTIKDDIYLVNKFLDHCQNRFPGVKITYIEGNHEYRLPRYLMKHAPGLFEMMTVPELFKLEERGIEFIPYVRNQLYTIEGTNLNVRHSPYSYSIHCAHACITKKFINLIFGCTHRYQESKLKAGDHNYYYACSNGCLIDFEHPIFGYMNTDNWSKGFSVVYTDGEWWQNNHVEIRDNRAVFAGYEFIGLKSFDFTK